MSLDSIFFDNTFEFSWEKLIYFWFSQNQSNNKYLRRVLISKVYTGCTYTTARWTAAVCDSMKVRRKTSQIEIELPLYIRACAFGLDLVILFKRWCCRIAEGEFFSALYLSQSIFVTIFITNLVPWTATKNFQRKSNTTFAPVARWCCASDMLGVVFARCPGVIFAV